MKKLFFFAVTVCFTVISIAQTAVLHSSGTETVFSGNTAFSDAVTAASATSDTIYLSSGTFNGVTTLAKSVVVYGAGFDVDSSYYTGSTDISAAMTLSSTASNTKFEGIKFLGKVNIGSGANNVSFKYNRFNDDLQTTGGAPNAMNLILVNNVFYSRVSLTNVQYAQIYNNILSLYSNTSNVIISNSMISNNVIYGQNSTTQYVFTGNNNTIRNNLIYSNTNNIITGSGNELFYNVINRATANFGTTPVEVGNWLNLNFHSIIYNSTTNSQHNDYADYHLLDPSTYIGSDGTQIGLYGGIYPFKDGFVPSNPHFSTSYIGNHTNPDGTLTIDVKVKAQED